ncbi:hypothetical protein [Ectopseudomonas mendocina]|uniref:hypothetical protein n=1 Tax=Ectopseudomonas mendocina TaxID=300 RepID=UPI000206DE68|nr:hypothetical protein MDS_2152 [Pseudomonas mendocina NK-01]
MSHQVVTAGRRCGKRLWPLFGYAQAHGWQITRTNGGHLRLTKPGRPIVHTSSTPSDWRAVRNAVAMLARADGYCVVETEHAIVEVANG